MMEISKMTFGLELEFGDVDRSLLIPPELGAWEYSERDIYNTQPPYRFVAADPLGIEPPVGGEINVFPGRSPEEVSERVSDLLDFFHENDNTPTVPCTSHLHVHVRVPGLRTVTDPLRRLSSWIKENQHDAIRVCGRYEDTAEVRKAGAKSYMKLDGGRPMPDWQLDNLMKATDFDDWIRLHCCGKDGVSRGRPFRHAINTYCMKHIDTIEWRMFRGSDDPDEIYDAIRLVRDCTKAALTVGTPFLDIYHHGGYCLPEFRFDPEAWAGHQATKWGEKRGKKERTFHDI